MKKSAIISIILAALTVLTAFGTVASAVTVTQTLEPIIVANYYDTGDCRNQGLGSMHEGKYGWKGAVSTKPTVERAPLDLDVESNWAKVGAVYAKNLNLDVPAKISGNKPVQDTENTSGMTYVDAKVVDGAAKSPDGNHFPANETPIIVYEVKADKGNYITSLDVTAWGCVMYGGADLTFYVTPECPTKVTDPELKDLTTYEYLSHFGYAFSAPTNQAGNYTDAEAWKFNAGEKLEYCGLDKKADNVVYVTAVFNVPATKDMGTDAVMTSGTDGKDQIRFMGCKIVAGQDKGETQPDTPTVVAGDANGDGKVTVKDAKYLLNHNAFASKYPIDDAQNTDYNNDGTTDADDVDYLLMHIFASASFPLYPGK